MNTIEKINKNIYRLTIPYKDIFTTVYVVETCEGALLFDCASFDEDIDGHIIPMMNELGIEDVRCVFISHNHKDHAGGLSEFMKHFPNTVIISRCPRLKEQFKSFTVIAPNDGDEILGMLKAVTIPGHTEDSCAIYDTRTNTLISGDCLQLYGIYGSGTWASNITFPDEHIKAVNKLRTMDISEILTAHDYHPYGYRYTENILKALDACIDPLMDIQKLIMDNPSMNDEEICDLYNSGTLPTLAVKVVTAIRNMGKGLSEKYGE